jgi:hypothetical protein
MRQVPGLCRLRLPSCDRIVASVDEVSGREDTRDVFVEDG